MDGSGVEHSDSDSGDSWTILEHTSLCVADAPTFENSPKCERDIEKDEDTDGISIISDSDPESSTPELNIDKSSQEEEICPTEEIHNNVMQETPLISYNNNYKSIKSEECLGDNTGKLKTYVHRRNKRLSTVLNIIMLGSVITAAGVAIGHMWGVRDDCLMQSTPSVNKILSNLYKLQEENAYLRNKITELTLINNIQMSQRKIGSEKITLRQNRCKKLYEASIDNKNIDKITRCMDENIIANNNNLMPSQHSKEFLGDIEKLKTIYEQNKSWLDDEISKRLKNEKLSIKNLKNSYKITKLTKQNKNLNTLKDENLKRQLEPVIEPLLETFENLQDSEENPADILKNSNTENGIPTQKFTYADSLKSSKGIDNMNRKINNIEYQVNNNNNDILKKKSKKEYDTISGNTVSEDELRKDDRYLGLKHKHEKKKHDRQKVNKKQKRRNKYEQWEMNGGYMKDYDDLSTSSSKDNFFRNADRKYENDELKKNDYIDQFSETDNNVNSKNKPRKHSKHNKGSKEKKEETNWFEKRAMVRHEARKKLEKELFDGNESTPNNAKWYFQRMQRREQCRAKGDNSTYRRPAKRNMNFKVKH